MYLVKSEEREKYIAFRTPRWELTPAPPPRPARPDAVDIIFIDYNSGAIDLAAAAQRVRELIGAAEIASANEALEGWVGDDPDANDYRCPYCGARDGACSH